MIALASGHVQRSCRGILFIPPYVSHQPANLSATEAAYALVARNDPNEQEHVFLVNPKD